MALTEHTINDALATVLRETRRAWSTSEVVTSENTGMLHGSNRRPDILVLEANVSPVAIGPWILAVNSSVFTRTGCGAAGAAGGGVSTAAGRSGCRVGQHGQRIAHRVRRPRRHGIAVQPGHRLPHRPRRGTLARGTTANWPPGSDNVAAAGVRGGNSIGRRTTRTTANSVVNGLETFKVFLAPWAAAARGESHQPSWPGSRAFPESRQRFLAGAAGFSGISSAFLAGAAGFSGISSAFLAGAVPCFEASSAFLAGCAGGLEACSGFFSVPAGFSEPSGLFTPSAGVSEALVGFVPISLGFLAVSSTFFDAAPGLAFSAAFSDTPPGSVAFAGFLAASFGVAADARTSWETISAAMAGG